MISGIPGVACGGGDKGATRDNEMEVEMLLHGLTPGMQDHGKADLTAQIFVSKLLQQLSRDFDEQIEEPFPIERQQPIENMVNSEDDVIIRNGQDPFFLGFEPLGFFKRTAFGAMPILARLIPKLPLIADITQFQDTAHRRRAAIQNGAHGFGLLIRKPMRLFVFTDVFSDYVSHIVFHP